MDSLRPGVSYRGFCNATGQVMGTPIVQALSNSSAGKQKVTYHLTPWTLNGSGSLKCAGTPLDVDTWVEPTVTVSAASDTVCNGASTS